MLSIVTLRNDVAGTAGADPASLVTTGHSLLADLQLDVPALAEPHARLLRPVLGYLLYRSGLVPRILPIIAFVGAPLLLASDIAIFFGV